MKGISLTAATVALTATTAMAGGIDRSGQDISILFEDGNHVKMGFASVNPDVPGAGGAFATQSAISFNSLSFAVKKQFTEKLGFALIVDEPYGADIRYVDGPLAALGAPLPGLDINGRALVGSKAVTALGRYEFGNGFSLHGGARMQKVDGQILAGAGLLDASSKWDVGYTGGAAYEIPDIALRVALTYNSAITHDLTGTHSNQPYGLTAADPATGSVRIPESINLDFQTGIAANTLLFGKIRHVKWEGTTLTSTKGGADTDWVEFTEDSTTFELGLGRKLNDNWSVAATIGYEKGSDTGTTFLAPTGTSTSFGLGASYTQDAYKISAGLKYINFDQKTVNGVPFEGDALAGGMSIDFMF
ncbi:transporter [Aliiroseovarius sp. KMU-50]|uniref:Transporter n=1 Tax=Aliiroseovarius salicola TaxID=3009082 RepID=A0ABT4W2U8_9RHOB|nr:transporter [Aliiroseovarius sp. KMU-50]MDA5094843.1 transporter [Aliiroseovarius sp. KMU-50]